jgi:hypothetical protein
MAPTLWSDDARVWNLSQVCGSEITQKAHADDSRLAAAVCAAARQGRG